MKQDLLFIKSIIASVFCISLATVHLWLSVVALVITIGYTARKWYLMEKRK